MVEKGLGWLLKEAYPKQPAAITGWLIEQRGRISRLVVRIAAEKMTRADRAAALSKPLYTESPE
jgi:3-methyladenine DNA glycosylase AlkD